MCSKRSIMGFMTPRQELFVSEYMIDLNASAAAIRAGYASGGIGCRLLSNPDIAVPISRALQQRAFAVKVDAEWVLKRAALLADFNISKFIRRVGGRACYDFSEATTDDWYCISEYTVKQIGRDSGPLLVQEVKLKSYDKLRALELVGRHVNVQAWKDRIGLDATVEIRKIAREIVEPKNTDG